MGDKDLRSGLYECEVVHQRLAPKKHGFRYRLFYLDIDLEELPRLRRRLWLFSHNRFNLFAFRDDDHLDLGAETLRENLARYLDGQGIELPADARVRLVTLPRVCGYIFNPVCFYFISDRDGKPMHAIAEVCNTFKELKPFLLPRAEGERFHLRAKKQFYVSPFSSLDTEFDFRLKVPGKQLEIHIDDIEGTSTMLLSWIRGERRALNDRRLAWYALKYPFLTLQVIAKIHWQALRLWMKKLPFHRKHENTDLQRDLYRPHDSLTDIQKTP